MSETWTTEYPTKPGYYWLRNYVLKTWRGDETTPGPELVEVDSEGDFRHTDSACATLKNWIVSAEWFGPILPPLDTYPTVIERLSLPPDTSFTA